MREYEVNTRVTDSGSHAFTLKGVSMYHRKEPFTISDIIYEVLEQTWAYRKYNVVMNAVPHDALSRRLAALAKYPIVGATTEWSYFYSEWLEGYCINVITDRYNGLPITTWLDGGRELDKVNAVLNSTGINLTWFDYVDQDGLNNADNNS